MDPISCRAASTRSWNVVFQDKLPKNRTGCPHLGTRCSACLASVKVTLPDASTAGLTFDDLLDKANTAVNEARKLSPCICFGRQYFVEQLFRDAEQAAATQTDLCYVRLALSSACLKFSEKARSVEQQLACVQSALVCFKDLEEQGVAVSTLAPQYQRCIQQALQILADPDPDPVLATAADLDRGLSFWNRLVKSVPRSSCILKCRLSMDQAEWALEKGRQCMAAAPDYKTGLKCGYEATGPVELAVETAHSSRVQSLMERSEQLREDIYTFIHCTCESVQASIRLRLELVILWCKWICLAGLLQATLTLCMCAGQKASRCHAGWFWVNAKRGRSLASGGQVHPSCETDRRNGPAQ